MNANLKSGNWSIQIAIALLGVAIGLLIRPLLAPSDVRITKEMAMLKNLAVVVPGGWRVIRSGPTVGELADGRGATLSVSATDLDKIQERDRYLRYPTEAGLVLYYRLESDGPMMRLVGYLNVHDDLYAVRARYTAPSDGPLSRLIDVNRSAQDVWWILTNSMEHV